MSPVPYGSTWDRNIRLSNSLFAHNLKPSYRKNFSCSVLPLIYVLGMIEYALKIIPRIVGVVKDLLILLGYILGFVFSFGRLCKKETISDKAITFGGALGEALSAIIGTVCPILANQIDEAIERHPYCAANSFPWILISRWTPDPDPREYAEGVGKEEDARRLAKKEVDDRKKLKTEAAALKEAIRWLQVANPTYDGSLPDDFDPQARLMMAILIWDERSLEDYKKFFDVRGLKKFNETLPLVQVEIAKLKSNFKITREQFLYDLSSSLLKTKIPSTTEYKLIDDLVHIGGPLLGNGYLFRILSSP